MKSGLLSDEGTRSCQLCSCFRSGVCPIAMILPLGVSLLNIQGLLVCLVQAHMLPCPCSSSDLQGKQRICFILWVNFKPQRVVLFF